MTWDIALNKKSTKRYLLQNFGKANREGTRMEKALLLLKHVYRDHNGFQKKDRFLLPHAALYFNKYLPVAILKHIFHYEDYLAEILEIEDVTKRSALHVAAVSSIEEDVFSKIIDVYYRASSGHSKRSLVTCGGNPNIPKELEEAAKCRDYQGKLPLIIALENGYGFGHSRKKDGVIDRLLEANPEAIGVRDRSSRLYPFMTAATVSLETLIPPKPPTRSLSNLLSWKRADSNLSTGREQITTIYELLLREPRIISRKRRKDP
jgi:hypothetical protein